MKYIQGNPVAVVRNNGDELFLPIFKLSEELGWCFSGLPLECRIKYRFGIESRIVHNLQNDDIAVQAVFHQPNAFINSVSVDELIKADSQLGVQYLGDIMAGKACQLRQVPNCKQGI